MRLSHYDLKNILNEAQTQLKRYPAPSFLNKHRHQDDIKTLIQDNHLDYFDNFVLSDLSLADLSHYLNSGLYNNDCLPHLIDYVTHLLFQQYTNALFTPNALFKKNLSNYHQLSRAYLLYPALCQLLEIERENKSLQQISDEIILQFNPTKNGSKNFNILITSSVEVYPAQKTEIAAGTSSTVYEITRNGKLAALKVFKKSAHDEATLRLFLSEIHMMRRFTKAQHKNHFVQFIKAQEDPLGLVILMEYCNYALFDWIDLNPDITQENTLTVTKYAKKIIKGIQYLNAEKIWHQDLKPENILLLTEGNKTRLKICDFGLSIHEFNPQKDAELVSRGTPEFVSPEVLSSAPNIDPKPCHIYSMAIIFWMMLHRQEPYQGRAIKRIMFDVVAHNRRPIIDEKNPFISTFFTPLLTTSWAATPRQRLSAEEFSQELKNIQNRLTFPSAAGKPSNLKNKNTAQQDYNNALLNLENTIKNCENLERKKSKPRESQISLVKAYLKQMRCIKTNDSHVLQLGTDALNAVATKLEKPEQVDNPFAIPMDAFAKTLAKTKPKYWRISTGICLMTAATLLGIASIACIATLKLSPAGIAGLYFTAKLFAMGATMTGSVVLKGTAVGSGVGFFAANYLRRSGKPTELHKMTCDVKTTLATN